MSKVISLSQEETQQVAARIAQKIPFHTIICLEGDLGAGKTTFTQGILAAFKAEKPYISPTFLIVKEYEIPKGRKVYHIDAYRIGSNDLLNLGWEEMIRDSNSIIIIEWAKKVHDVIPSSAHWLYFSWKSETAREISSPTLDLSP